MNTEKINRFEIIHHVACEECQGSGLVRVPGVKELKQCIGCSGSGCRGREVVFWDDNKQLDIDVQDDGRTLKLFIHERYQ